MFVETKTWNLSTSILDLVQNKKNHGASGDFCYICKEAIHSRLIHSVYSCSSTSDNVDDFKESRVTRNRSLLGVDSSPLIVTNNDDDFDCAKLFMHKNCHRVGHPGHIQHELMLLSCPAFLCCYACQKDHEFDIVVAM